MEASFTPKGSQVQILYRPPSQVAQPMALENPKPIGDLAPDELVGELAFKTRRNEVIRALVGGLTAKELRKVVLSQPAFDAMVKGLSHPNAKVRWWCIQLFDHVGDERCVPHLIEALNDPIAKVAKHARHALACEKCKPSGDVLSRMKATEDIVLGKDKHSLTQEHV